MSAQERQPDIVDDDYQEMEAGDIENPDSEQQLGECLPFVNYHHGTCTNPLLDRDENEAIGKSNIIQGDGLRHAKPQTENGYNEGPNEDELPEEAV